MTSRPRPVRRLAATGALTLLVLVTWRVAAGPPLLPAPPKPPPAHRNVRYGPHERNVLDLWRARPTPDRPGTPLVVFFHGGGFRQGDKSSLPARLLLDCLAAGISVATANYRFSQDAPYPAPMLDGARAIQYLRAHAREFGIDPDRIAASGSSAGAGISLWLAFHDDIADSASPDPVLRQSSRLSCAGVDGAQTSYDPRFIRQVIGGRAHEHPALKPFFGLDDCDHETPRADHAFRDASPIEHVTANDPPVLLYYAEPDRPIPTDARPGQGIHHPRFGRALRAKLEPLGVSCELRHMADLPPGTDHNSAIARDLTDFFARNLLP